MDIKEDSIRGRDRKSPYGQLTYDPETRRFTIRVDDREDRVFWLEVSINRSDLQKAIEETRIINHG